MDPPSIPQYIYTYIHTVLIIKWPIQHPFTFTPLDSSHVSPFLAVHFMPCQPFTVACQVSASAVHAALLRAATRPEEGINQLKSVIPCLLHPPSHSSSGFVKPGQVVSSIVGLAAAFETTSVHSKSCWQEVVCTVRVCSVLDAFQC